MTPEARAEHCRTIGAHGGASTRDKYGSLHMQTIGKAGAQATITKHSYGYWCGIVKGKGYKRKRKPNLQDDLRAANELAAPDY